MSNKRDYYDILGLQKGASKDEIKKAYRKVAMKYHPDRNPGDAEAEAKFKEASEAAEVLTNEQKRQRYDQFAMQELMDKRVASVELKVSLILEISLVIFLVIFLVAVVLVEDVVLKVFQEMIYKLLLT